MTYIISIHKLIHKIQKHQLFLFFTCANLNKITFPVFTDELIHFSGKGGKHVGLLCNDLPLTLNPVIIIQNCIIILFDKVICIHIIIILCNYRVFIGRLIDHNQLFVFENQNIQHCNNNNNINRSY